MPRITRLPLTQFTCAILIMYRCPHFPGTIIVGLQGGGGRRSVNGYSMVAAPGGVDPRRAGWMAGRFVGWGVGGRTGSAPVGPRGDADRGRYWRGCYPLSHTHPVQLDSQGIARSELQHAGGRDPGADGGPDRSGPAFVQPFRAARLARRDRPRRSERDPGDSGYVSDVCCGSGTCPSSCRSGIAGEERPAEL